MSDPALGLQGALVVRLKASSALAAIIGDRVYDLPPKGPQYPYLTLGEDQVIGDDADCYDGSEVYLTLHAWSRAVGFPEVKRIVAAMRDALHLAPLAISDHRLVELRYQDARYLRDPDGLTSHAVITFRALLEPVA